MAERILIVDDDADTRQSLVAIATRDGWTVEEAADGESALRLIKRQAYDLVLSDLVMPRIDGLELLRRLRAAGIRVPFVMITGHATVETAVEAMRIGAFDYLSKPVRLGVLRSVLAKVRRVRRAEDSETSTEGPRLEGVSEGIRRIKELIELAAPSRSTVLITGETGTGKEIIAEMIHRQSPRASKRLVKVNCAGLPENLIESELFGHEKGAFTGADRAREGRFEAADHGTLFLDEISEMSWSAQARLLRVIEAGEFERVGSSETRKVSARVIAATNQDLKRLSQEKRFREDLYYRVRVIEIRILPLRERREDLPILTEAFLQRLSREHGRPVPPVSDRVARAFAAYSWPGNVRELEHVLEHAFILCRGGEIGPEHLPAELRPERPRAVQIPVGTPLERAEREIIQATLEAVDDDKREAARLLGLSRSALYRRLGELASGKPQGPIREEPGSGEGDSAGESAGPVDRPVEDR
ncbi:MAG: sigma-54-dependent Fis family transcriptional regulator [Candidatus Eisenbacteria bacterium]|nr:sigma-54-dependent Fis family transcriptional regulator [Candidatus Eisenbacteria bacterium]